MSDTRKVRCRWCGCEITLFIPEHEFMRKLMLDKGLRCGCNRCTDYHRSRASLRDLLQEQAFFLNRKVGDSKLSEARNCIRNSVVKLIQLAEEHYLLSGLQKDADEFVTGVCDNPESATVMANMFERGVIDIARETHLA